jgi:hypothetical protein
VGRLSGAGAVDRVCGRDRHGVRRRRPADRVVLSSLPRQHEPIRPDPLDLRRRPRFTRQHLFAGVDARDRSAPRREAGTELGGRLRRSPRAGWGAPLGGRFTFESGWQRRRPLFQRGQGRRHRGPHGQSGSRRRVRHHRARGPPARASRGSGRPDGLLRPCAVDHARIRHSSGAAAAPNEHEAGGAGRVQQRSRRGRRRSPPDERALHPGTHPPTAQLREHPGHLVRAPACPRPAGRASGGAGNPRPAHAGRGRLLPCHIHGHGQVGAGREARGHRPRRLWRDRRDRRPAHRRPGHRSSAPGRRRGPPGPSRPGSESDHDTSGRADRHPRRRRARIPPRQRRGRRALAAVTARSRAPHLPVERDSSRLDRDRRRTAGVDRRSRGDRRRCCLPLGSPSGCPEVEGRPDSQLEGGAGRRFLRIAGARRGRCALRPRAGTRPDRGASPLGAVGHRPGGGAGRRDPHVRQRAPHVGVATPALRMELELRPHQHQRRPATGSDPPRPRPPGGRVVGHPGPRRARSTARTSQPCWRTPMRRSPHPSCPGMP